VSVFIPGTQSFVFLCGLRPNSQYRATMAMSNDFGWGGWSAVSQPFTFEFSFIRLTQMSAGANGDYRKMTSSQLGPWRPHETPYISDNGEMIIYKTLENRAVFGVGRTTDHLKLGGSYDAVVMDPVCNETSSPDGLDYRGCQKKTRFNQVCYRSPDPWWSSSPRRRRGGIGYTNPICRATKSSDGGMLYHLRDAIPPSDDQAYTPPIWCYTAFTSYSNHKWDFCYPKWPHDTGNEAPLGAVRLQHDVSASGYYFKITTVDFSKIMSAGSRVGAYFGFMIPPRFKDKIINNAILQMSQCRYNQKVWEGKIRMFAPVSSKFAAGTSAKVIDGGGRREPRGPEYTFLAGDSLTTSTNCKGTSIAPHGQPTCRDGDYKLEMCKNMAALIQDDTAPAEHMFPEVLQHQKAFSEGMLLDTTLDRSFGRTLHGKGAWTDCITMPQLVAGSLYHPQKWQVVERTGYFVETTGTGWHKVCPDSATSETICQKLGFDSGSAVTDTSLLPPSRCADDHRRRSAVKCSGSRKAGYKGSTSCPVIETYSWNVIKKTQVPKALYMEPSLVQGIAPEDIFSHTRCNISARKGNFAEEVDCANLWLTRGTDAKRVDYKGQMQWMVPYVASGFPIETANGLYFLVTGATDYSNGRYKLSKFGSNWKIQLATTTVYASSCDIEIMSSDKQSQGGDCKWTSSGSTNTMKVQKRSVQSWDKTCVDNMLDVAAGAANEPVNVVRSCRHETYVDTINKNFMLSGSYCVDKTLKDATGNTITDADLAKCEWFQGYKNSTKPCEVVYQVWYNRDAAEWCTDGGCIQSIAANPIEIDLAAFVGSWRIALLTDFNYEPQAGGTTKSGNKKGKPTIPLIKFAGDEESVECRQNTDQNSPLFDLKKMNDAGVDLPAENACKQVAGKWTEDGQVSEEFYGAWKGWWPKNEVTDAASAKAIYGGPTGNDNTGATDHVAEEKKVGQLEQKISGITNDAIASCSKRGEYIAASNKNHDALEVKHAADMVKKAGKGKWVCSLLTEFDIAFAGIGVSLDLLKSICERIVGWYVQIDAYLRVRAGAMRKFQQTSHASGDCDRVTIGFETARLFCDMHCVRRIVRDVDKGLLREVGEMVRALGQNMELVSNYHSRSLIDKVSEIKDSQKSLLKPLLIEQAQASKGRLLAMFIEMRSMLGGNLHAEGLVTARRSFDTFKRRFSNPTIEGLANVSMLMEDLSSETAKLLGTIHLATTSRLSHAGAAARETALALHVMNARLREHNLMLGVYQSSAFDAKHRQAQLSKAGSSITGLKREVQRKAVSDLLMELERSWWTIREKFDAYLDEADSQAKVFGNALVVLEDYTQKCTANVGDLSDAQSRVARSQRNSELQLRNTWHYVVYELGQLVAKISDTHAFNKLSRWDVSSADVQANRTNMCGGGSSARAAAHTEAREILNGGFAFQTWMQINGIFQEMPSFSMQFEYLGMPPPGNVRILEQAQARAVVAFSEDMLQPLDGALDLVAKVCHHEP